MNITKRFKFKMSDITHCRNANKMLVQTPLSKWFSIAATALCLAAPLTIRAADLDQDGLDDVVEGMLIDRHSPYLLFDDRERFWPASTVWFVKRSQLLLGADTILSKSTLDAQPALALQQTAPTGESSS
jgi:hypothetical protein